MLKMIHPVVSTSLCWRQFVLVLAFLLPNFGYAQIPPGFIRESIATGLNPTSMLIAPDGRIFITEKNGLIRIIRDDQLLAEPFLTIEVDDSNERGLGHMVLHPNFEQNGYYYIFYSVPGLRFNRVSRFTAFGDYTITDSETIILDLDQLGNDFHNGGDMIFGLDGYLYISTGDGGHHWNSSDLTSTNGKILRIDDTGNAVPDNPWYDPDAPRTSLLYAYGFRNPFTMTLHPHTGVIYANDVGGMKFEEVNRVEKGKFYGWPSVEGKRTHQVVPPEYQDPIFQYGHENYYCAIVGSSFYLPEVVQFPEIYVGKYFYSDYCTGRIRMLNVDTGLDQGVFISDGDRVVDMEVSADGTFYYLERRGLGDGTPEDNTKTDEGVLWKVSYTGSGAPFISNHPESVLVSIGEAARVQVKASGALPLSYRWLINGHEDPSFVGPEFIFAFATLQDDSARIEVEISNSFGLVISNEAILRVTANQRPYPVIVSPVEGYLYTAGDSILLSGFALDPEDGTIPDSLLYWRVDFHHGTHTHPGLSWTRGSQPVLWFIPTLGETSTDVWYRIYLRAIDSEGLSQIHYRDIFPRTGNVTIHSSPEGLTVFLDGAPLVTPYTFESVNQLSRFISSPAKQVLRDSVYFFQRWNDPWPAQQREITAKDQDQSYTAYFESVRNGRGYGLTATYYDNITFEGPPVGTAIDSILDHRFLLNSPFPGVPEDYFGIEWTGYIQPYRTGVYRFTVFVDDRAYVEIDGQVLIDNQEPGVNHETGIIFLETGRLYPVRLRLIEYSWTAQFRFRWSSPDFPEEVVPSSQLYPEDIISRPRISEILSMETLVGDNLQVLSESYQDVRIDFSVVNVLGQTWRFPGHWMSIGKNIITLDIRQLPPGLYYLQAINPVNGQSISTVFVKAR